MQIIPALWRVLGFILLGSLPWMIPGWVSEVPANMVFSKLKLEFVALETELGLSGKF